MTTRQAKPVTKDSKGAAEVNRTKSDEVETTSSGDLKTELKALTSFGLELKTDGDTFTTNFMGREDSGSLNQPINSIVTVARNLIGEETIKRLQDQKKEAEKAKK